MGKIFDALQKSDKESYSSKVEHSQGIVEENNYEDKGIASKDQRTDTFSVQQKIIDKRILFNSDAKSLIADQFRILRTQVLRKCREKNFRSILVTSAMPQEGKTTIAVNLAAGLSQCINEKAMVIDFDLRKADVGPMFGLNGSAGIWDYFINGTDLSKVVCSTGIDDLLLITAGRSNREPTDVLSAKKVEQMFSDLKSRYSDYYIVIDSTPLELTSEVNLLADMCDAILLVIGAGLTEQEQILRAVRSLNRDKIIGVALNGVDPRLSYYKKYYDNKYYKNYQ